MEKICKTCKHWNPMSDDYGKCMNVTNLTYCMSFERAKRLLKCNDNEAAMIEDSIRYHKNFGCNLWESV